MKLKPVQTCAPAELKGRIPGELHTALVAYTAYYRETTGQPIEVWPQMLSSSWTRIGSSKRGAGPRTGVAGDR